MHSRVVRISLVVAGLVVMVLFCLQPAAVAAPSAELGAALDKKLPDMNLENSKLHTQVQRLLFRAHESGLVDSVNIGIEYDDSQPVPRGNLYTRNATMREQLDAIAKGTGYVWQANGDCINLIPKGKHGDAKWVLNQVMEGTIVVSRHSSVATPVKDWFAQRGISGVRDVHNVRIEGFERPPGPDPIVLHNPTLREYSNARERMYGNNIWSRRVKVLPLQDGETIQRTVLVCWSQCTRLVRKQEPAD